MRAPLSQVALGMDPNLTKAHLPKLPRVKLQVSTVA